MVLVTVEMRCYHLGRGWDTNGWSWPNREEVVTEHTDSFPPGSGPSNFDGVPPQSTLTGRTGVLEAAVRISEIGFLVSTKPGPIHLSYSLKLLAVRKEGVDFPGYVFGARHGGQVPRSLHDHQFTVRYEGLGIRHPLGAIEDISFTME